MIEKLFFILFGIIVVLIIIVSSMIHPILGFLVSIGSLGFWSTFLGVMFDEN